MAIAVMDALRMELGLRIPLDVSVVGFDNVRQAAWGSYQLTSVEQDADAIRLAADTLDTITSRLTLTAADRGAIYRASRYISQNDAFEGMAEDADTLDALLERTK